MYHSSPRESVLKIFEEKLGYNPTYFSYPFGEYSLSQKKYIHQKFNFAFGQHSGVIDTNKDKYELARFPINEKYGDLKRFEFLVNFNLPRIYRGARGLLKMDLPKMEFTKDLPNMYQRW